MDLVIFKKMSAIFVGYRWRQRKREADKVKTAITSLLRRTSFFFQKAEQKDVEGFGVVKWICKFRVSLKTLDEFLI